MPVEEGNKLGGVFLTEGFVQRDGGVTQDGVQELQVISHG
jgi:hypothetical protein